MTQDQNEKPARKAERERLKKLAEQERDAHINRKVRRTLRERLDRLDQRAFLHPEEDLE